MGILAEMISWNLAARSNSSDTFWKWSNKRLRVIFVTVSVLILMSGSALGLSPVIPVGKNSIEEAKKKLGEGDLQKLLAGTDTWEVA